MLIWSKIFVFELRPTKFGRLVALPKGFPKMPKKWTKVQNLTPNMCSPTGFRGHFWHRAIGGLSPCLSSKIG